MKNKHLTLLIGVCLASAIFTLVVGAKSASEGDYSISAKPTPTPSKGSENTVVPCMMPSKTVVQVPVPTPTPTPPRSGPGFQRKNILSERTRSSVAAVMQQSDWDCDGISDYEDNCISAPNPDQVDKDKNGQGDACEETVLHGAQVSQPKGCTMPIHEVRKPTGPEPAPRSTSETPRKRKRLRQDIRDSAGEELTPANVRAMAESVDSDCDGISNWDDNCAYTFNPKQEDRNKNGIGDVCERKRRP